MNGTWFNYGAQAASNPTAFVNSWRKMKTVSDAAGATNISWVWCPNTVFSGSTSLSSLYPGDAYVDWTGIDGYNWGSVKGGWVSFSSMFDATYSQVTSLAPSKPLAICEIGCHDEAGQDKGAWITDMFSKLPTYSVVKALVWFNWWIAEGSTRVQWPIESPIDIAGSTATTSFATGISNSRYKSSAVVTAGSGKPQVP
jgi:beta-mannanase